MRKIVLEEAGTDNKIHKIETKISWWNKISAGVGLVVGYIIFGVYLIFTPMQVVKVESQRPFIKKRKLEEFLRM